MASIAAIHHALCEIDPAAGDVVIGVDIGDPVNGARVNAHPELEFLAMAKDSRNLRRTLHGYYGILKKHESHSVACWQRDQLLVCRSVPKFRRSAHDGLELLNSIRLLIHRQL